jgi:uncharacterized small protein (DUF1192 family)
MIEDGAEPRSSRGHLLLALSREDLEAYSAEDLVSRIEDLKAEIVRVEAQRVKKASVRSSADALFSFKSGDPGS